MPRRRSYKFLINVGFKKGCVPYNKGQSSSCTQDSISLPGYVRATKKQYQQVNRDSSERAREQEANAQPPMLLRPTTTSDSQLDAAQTPRQQDPDLQTYRLLHLQKTAHLWNEAIHEHRKYSRYCKGKLMWDMAGEVQWGLGWKERLKCLRCDYVSERHKLYDEVPSDRPGPKAATCNYGAQVGMAHTSVSNTGLAKILLAANTPAPSLSSMQAAANKVGSILENTNNKSMDNIRQELYTVNKLRGLPGDTPIDIETDCRYNNPVYSGVGKTPFQPATQCTQLVVENSTSRKQVVAVTNKSKLCQTCAKYGPAYQHNCKANLATDATIGDERRWAAECLKDLKRDGITVHHVTTDADSKSFAAAQDVHKAEKSESLPPKQQIDTRHVTSSQRRHVKLTRFSTTMFPRRTAEHRKSDQNRFSIDIPARCHAEHAAALEKSGGDTEEAAKLLKHAKSAIAQCYTGDHSQCEKHSLVCAAKPHNNWVLHSGVLPADFRIKPTQGDRLLLMKLINYRLGPHILSKMKHLLNTQKTESVNRAVNHTVPLKR